MVFAEDTLFNVYSPLGEFEAQERAAAIVQRLRFLARNDWPLEALRFVENDGVTDVLLDTLRVFSVTAIDAVAAGGTRSEVAQYYRTMVQQRVAARRTIVSLKAVATSAGIILLLLIGLLLAFWLMTKIFPRGYAKLESWEGSLFRPITFRSQQVVSAGSIGAVFIILLKGIRLALSLAFLYFFFDYLLSILPWTSSWNVRPVLNGLLFSILVTAAALALFRAVHAAMNALVAKVNGWRGTIIKPVKIKTVEVFSEDRIVELVQFGIKISRFAAVVLLAYLYITLFFSLFTFSQTWAETLVGYIVRPLKDVLLGFVGYLPNLFFIFVIAFVTRYVIKFIHLVFLEVGRGTITFRTSSTKPA